jgi:hypothetical protein
MEFSAKTHGTSLIMNQQIKISKNVNKKVFRKENTYVSIYVGLEKSRIFLILGKIYFFNPRLNTIIFVPAFNITYASLKVLYTFY